MTGGVLRPTDISRADSARMLSFLNAVETAQALAETVGFSDGMAAGTRVAEQILAARKAAGTLRTLDQVLDITGVTLVRFTELAVALSAARPPFPVETLRFLKGSDTVWLGQSHPISVQLTDASGRGIPNRPVTLLASDGDLTAQIGLDRQRGRALRLTTDPGGLIRVSFGPHLVPQLSVAELTALGAELSNLPPDANAPQDAAAALNSLAARYRGQGSATLQAVIDRMYAAFAPDRLPTSSPWPSQHVSILAMIHDAQGQVSQMATRSLDVRNWLGGFHSALAQEIEGNSPLSDALQFLSADAEAGLDLSRKIIQATQGFSAIERGILGRDIRDRITGRDVSAFLDQNAETLEGSSVINSVRAAGASEAAIAAGGFAVFEAIRTVQDAGDVIAAPNAKPGGLVNGDFDSLRDRVIGLEGSVATQTDLARVDRDLQSQIAGLDNRFVQTDALNGFRDQINADLDSRLADQVPRTEFDQRLTSLQTQFTQDLTAVQENSVTQTQFDALRTDLEQDIGTRVTTTDFNRQITSLQTQFTQDLTAVQENSVTQTQFDALRTDLEQDIGTRVTTTDFNRQINTLQSRFTRDLAAVQESSVTQNQLESLRSDLEKEIDSRFEGIGDFGAFDARFNELEASFNARMEQISADAVREERFGTFREEITADVDARLENTVTRAEMDSRIAVVEDNTAASLRTKANASTVSSLSRTVNTMAAEQTQLRDDVIKLDTRVGTTDPNIIVTRR